MKILLVRSISINLHDIKGGVDAVVVNLMNAFTACDVEVHLFSITKDVKIYNTIKYADNIIIDFVPLTLPSYLAEYLLFGSRKLCKKITEFEPDIIHIQGTGFHLLYLRKAPLDKVIATQHAILSEEVKYQFGLLSKMKYHFKVMVESLFLQKIHHLIYISEYNKNLNSFGKDARKRITMKIYNPVNPCFFHTAAISNNNNNLIFVGAINQRKGLLLLLQALKNLKSRRKLYQLHVVGDFTQPAYEKVIRNYITENALQPQVIFHGWKKQDEIFKLMSASSIFVLPSYQETLPVSIAEAMAAGRVVIASDTGGVSEMFKDKESGFLFNIGDVDKLTSILMSLHNNIKEMKKISEKARDEALLKFEPGSVVNQTIGFYKKVLRQ